jgi:hypothetical protein
LISADIRAEVETDVPVASPRVEVWCARAPPPLETVASSGGAE